MIARMCLGVIKRFVDDSIHHHIAAKTTAYRAWITLKETYEKYFSNHQNISFKEVRVSQAHRWLSYIDSP